MTTNNEGLLWAVGFIWQGTSGQAALLTLSFYLFARWNFPR